MRAYHLRGCAFPHSLFALGPWPRTSGGTDNGRGGDRMYEYEATRRRVSQATNDGLCVPPSGQGRLGHVAP